MSINPQLVTLVLSLGLSQASRFVNLDAYVWQIRALYITAQVILFSIYLSIAAKVRSIDDTTLLKYVEPKPFGVSRVPFHSSDRSLTAFLVGCDRPATVGCSDDSSQLRPARGLESIAELIHGSGYHRMDAFVRELHDKITKYLIPSQIPQIHAAAASLKPHSLVFSVPLECKLTASMAESHV